MINQTEKTGLFYLRTGWIRSAEFVQSSQIVIKAGVAMRLCTLAIDTKIPKLQATMIKDFFAQAPDGFSSLKRIASGIPDLSSNLVGIDWIAVSPKYSAAGKYNRQTKVLGLNLRSVMAEIKRADIEKSENMRADAKTVMNGVDNAASATGTIFSVEYSTGPGPDLLKAVINPQTGRPLVPFDVKQVRQKDDFGFYDRLIDEVGLSNIGRYELEMGIIREMFRQGMSEGDKDSLFNGITLALRGDRVTAKPGYALMLAIRSADNKGYLEKFERLVTKQVTSGTKKTAKKLRAANKTSQTPDVVAVLTLAAYTGKIKEETAAAYLDGRLNVPQYREVQAELRKYIQNAQDFMNEEGKEEKRILTLRFIIDTIKGI